MKELKKLGSVLGRPCLLIAPLGGDGIYLIRAGNEKLVFKQHPRAGIEARMLEFLRPYLNVPAVLWADDGGVVMEYLEDSGRIDEAAAATALASLHAVTHKDFGFAFDTTIGPHNQPNTPTASWITFYRDQRVLSMARRCHEKGRFDTRMLERIDRITQRFESLLFEPKPSLLHGDIWSGNVIGCKKGVYFIDPAVYYGHNEVELAFIRMFNTFGTHFFDVYHSLNPIDKGFFEERQYIYQLYPVLVHVNSFGAGYMGMLERILARFL